MSFDRLATARSLTLPIHSLFLELPEPASPVSSRESFHGHVGVWFGLSSLLLQRLDPVTLTISCDSRTALPPIYHPLDGLCWPRLRRVTFDHAACWVIHLKAVVATTEHEDGVVLRYRVNTLAPSLGLLIQYWWEDVQAG